MEVDESQGTETEVVEEQSVAPESQEGGDSLNPAWNDLMQVVPSQLHSQVIPHLKKWDTNFQSKINEVHSQYSPYKDFLENQIDPARINYALQMAQAIEERPAEVYKAIREYAKQRGITLEEATEEIAEQQGQIDQTEIPDDLLKHPEIQKMQQMLNTMAQAFVAQQQTKQQSEEDAALEAEISELTSKHGEFDVDWVLTKAVKDANEGKTINSLEPYVQAYREFEQSLLAKHNKPTPKVMPPGGIAPNSQVDMSKLDDKERRAMAVKMLEAAAQQRQ